MVAVGGTDPVSFSPLAAEVVLPHDTRDFLMVDNHAFTLQLLGDAPITILWILQAQIGDMGDECRFWGNRLWLVVVASCW